jgi:hypothetical protein
VTFAALPPEIHVVAAALRDLDAAWAVAGGWALDLVVRVLAPEVVLLYKSRAPRPADEADFGAARPLLDVEGRAWLRDALLRARPDHPWAAALADSVAAPGAGG